MSTILHLNSSLWGKDSRSNQLSKQLVEQLNKDKNTVISRNLTGDNMPHLSADAYQAFAIPAEQRNKQQQQALALSDQLCEELLAADAVVLTAPVYNYGMPSTLKAWIDHVARAGVTFQYGERGMEGLLGGKKLYVISLRGGQHLGTERELLSQHIKQVFGMLGITDVTFIYAEGMAFGEQAANEAMNAAQSRIAGLAA